ncbi:MAG TPA: DUF309 domain-containing protein [Candidatus Limnocylindrales bacterium]|nr:DUF309 domain-containing protein [Candidatus Limnocylindrales bacterium]
MVAAPVVGGRIVQGGRSKAYRPLPTRTRRAALRAGIAAYRRGDFFEAHELLEPAWMGTRDLAEREALQGLIKLAAAYVHAVRGNPRGVAKNLEGAEDRVRRALADGPGAGIGVDLAGLADGIAERRAAIAVASSWPAEAAETAAELLATAPPPELAPVP